MVDIVDHHCLQHKTVPQFAMRSIIFALDKI
ncbi:hypothetical protein F441_06331 [Phytophthora nicotianae CJ01A1]|uniref:Uncharacterized protein n=6 Tax=Phytophthora nicotianae TaxID=4792 RepID=W2RAX0_PHYN3|nr:hypothetical protein PPTG_20932 [Phytophthora nicotianae INRA-310]ETI50044.1 hypothetical protein F443_06323 [Phytophthora nicotianae P1569]ETK89931.1 hypothetical protein L915_06197 [Phytophthora nicotianae]ETO78788.1 hypothetical protein F444_06386 [Phytophthora nicotianae P1976]ETP19812.1 hypothetical protein F441_06331 [Phytophthora nicotianae CJ01A1]ETP47769.1 hypothetical protein F442_06366 [Phytophthora nicotianae P10297]